MLEAVKDKLMHMHLKDLDKDMGTDFPQLIDGP